MKLIFTLLYLFAVAAMWYFRLPCGWIYLFGIPCMGCGMTRAWIAFLSLDFKTAFLMHPMFLSVPAEYGDL